MLEQLLAKALPVYSHFNFKEVNYNSIGFLTFYVVLVGYSKLPKQGARKWVFSYIFWWMNDVQFKTRDCFCVMEEEAGFPQSLKQQNIKKKSTGTNVEKVGHGVADENV